jgi:hypothetical protein
MRIIEARRALWRAVPQILSNHQQAIGAFQMNGQKIAPSVRGVSQVISHVS